MKMKILTVTALTALVLSAAGCAGPEEVKDKTMTFAEAKAMAAERGVPLLLDFYTDW
jgi:hypothetical protein